MTEPMILDQVSIWNFNNDQIACAISKPVLIFFGQCNIHLKGSSKFHENFVIRQNVPSLIRKYAMKLWLWGRPKIGHMNAYRFTQLATILVSKWRWNKRERKKTYTLRNNSVWKWSLGSHDLGSQISFN